MPTRPGLTPPHKPLPRSQRRRTRFVATLRREEETVQLNDNKSCLRGDCSSLESGQRRCKICEAVGGAPGVWEGMDKDARVL